MHLSFLPILAEAGGGFIQITRDFGINLPSILSQVIGFAIVAWVLWQFGFKPVIATLDERQKKIESGLQYADEMKAKLAEAQKASDAQLQAAQHKASEILAEAQKAAKEFADKQQQETAERTAAALAKAKEAIELEKKKMLAETRAEVARLVVATTQKVLAKELSELERTRFSEAAARELAQG